MTHAPNGATALQYGRTIPFDVELTDLGLTDGSGIEIGRELGTRMPVVALSGYGVVPHLRNSAMAGFSDHLLKLAEPAAVHRALQRAVECHRAPA